MVKEELEDLYKAYERALVSNDIDSLEDFFWDSPETVRFGPEENLFGSEAIQEFRRNRSPEWLARTVTRVEYILLDDNHGIINLCFDRNYKGRLREGRQTQVWKRFTDLGWKVVSAHVSLMEKAD